VLLGHWHFVAAVLPATGCLPVTSMSPVVANGTACFGQLICWLIAGLSTVYMSPLTSLLCDCCTTCCAALADANGFLLSTV